MWQESELQILKELVGYYPVQVIESRINKWNKENQTGITRTTNSILIKLSRLNVLEKKKKKKTGTQKQWSKAEIEYLSSLVSSYPLELITKKINRWHRRFKTGVRRSVCAVRKKINSSKYSVNPIDDNMTANEWARQLGLSRNRVLRWKREQGLKHLIINKRKLAINVKDMTDFAERKPHLFCMAKKETLLYYFGEELTEKIESSKTKCPEIAFKSKPIQRTDTGEIYCSMAKASRELGLDQMTVAREAKREGWLRFV